MAKRTTKPAFNVEAKLPILETSLLEGKTIKESLELAKIPRSIFYRWLALNPEYRDTLEGIRGAVDQLADDALARQLEAEPSDAEHRREIAAIAFKIREERRQRRENTPMLPAGGAIQDARQINFNFGNQITAEEMQDFTDDELELVRSGQKTFDQIRAERKLGKPTKPQR